MENFEEWTPDQKEAASNLVRNIFSEIKNFKTNIKNLNEEKFKMVFGEVEGKRHWRNLEESGQNITKYGTENFTEEQKKAMVSFLKQDQN